MAKADTGSEGAPKKGGLMAVLVPVAVLTILAAGGGGLIGSQIVAAVRAPHAEATAKEKTPAPARESASLLKELTPIVTNLASPDNASWIRLQAAIVYDKADAADIEVLAVKINEDVLAMVRTLTLAQLQGASGLEMLREDLSERASIRSDGHVRELMIETLVIQ